MVGAVSAVGARFVSRGFLLAATLFLTSCGSSPVGPSATTATSTTGSQKPSFLLVFSPVNATYSAQFDGKTYTAAGGFVLEAAPGAYTITGSFTGQAFAVTFSSLLGGGPQSGSLKSTAGPSPSVLACQVQYFNNGLQTQAQSFSMTFTITSSPSSACQ